MRFSACVVATDPVAHQAATSYLEAGGDAVGAAVCGFFAAAGEHPEVLLGPTALMLARVGVGVRAFDGRARQAGLGLRRRKGLSNVELTPEAARASVPTGMTALLVALRYGQGTGLSKVVAPGVTIAQRNGAERRAEVLDAIQRLGASALADPLLHKPLAYRAGPTEGGLLTVDDLRSIPTVDFVANCQGNRYQLPWQLQGNSQSDTQGSDCNHAGDSLPGLAVMDAGGGLALLGYCRQDNGLAIPELELTLPLHGEASERGAVRTQPGTVLPWRRELRLEIANDGSPAGGTIGLADDQILRLQASEAPAWGNANTSAQ